MEMYGNAICVSYSELVGSGLISQPTYKKYVREGKLILLQRGGNGREALIAYRSMPDRIRAAYDEQFKNAHEEMKQREQENTSAPGYASMPRRCGSFRTTARPSIKTDSWTTFSTHR